MFRRMTHALFRNRGLPCTSSARFAVTLSMRFALAFLAVVSTAPLSALRAADAPPTLTLEQALAAVEKVNLSVLLSRESVVQALEQANLSRVGVLPIVNASAVQ